MNRITALQAAEKWGLSLRTVQHLCKQGKIHGAQRFGTSWMIPSDSPRPPDGRHKAVKSRAASFTPLLRKTPFLDMTDLYSEPGTADKCIEALANHPEAQKLFAAEIAYSRGEIDKVYEHGNDFLKTNSVLYSVISSSILLSLCAMWKGDVQLWYKAKKHLLDAPCKSEQDREIIFLAMASIDCSVRNTKDFPEWFARGCFDSLPTDATPAASVYYVQHLLINAQELALGNVKIDGIQGLGFFKALPYMIEPLISQMVANKIIMAEIYLRLMCAIAYNQTGDTVRSGEHLDKAISLCLADGFYGPLAERRRQLGTLLDDRLSMIDPHALKKVKELHKQLVSGWTVIHNAVTQRTVSSTLTVREREVARLAAFGLTDRQIGKQLNISESSVKVIIRSAKTKTNVEKRIELALYI